MIVKKESWLISSGWHSQPGLSSITTAQMALIWSFSESSAQLMVDIRKRIHWRHSARDGKQSNKWSAASNGITPRLQTMISTEDETRQIGAEEDDYPQGLLEHKLQVKKISTAVSIYIWSIQSIFFQSCLIIIGFKHDKITFHRFHTFQIVWEIGFLDNLDILPKCFEGNYSWDHLRHLYLGNLILITSFREWSRFNFPF